MIKQFGNMHFGLRHTPTGLLNNVTKFVRTKLHFCIASYMQIHHCLCLGQFFNAVCVCFFFYLISRLRSLVCAVLLILYSVLCVR